jgi:hypothetical protein
MVKTILLEDVCRIQIKFDIQFGWLEAVDLPLPIPNRVVKRCTADDTLYGESRQPPILSTEFGLLTYFMRGV